MALWMQRQTGAHQKETPIMSSLHDYAQEILEHLGETDGSYEEATRLTAAECGYPMATVDLKDGVPQLLHGGPKGVPWFFLITEALANIFDADVVAASIPELANLGPVAIITLCPPRPVSRRSSERQTGWLTWISQQWPDATLVLTP
jgi:hypothetical protein